MAGFLIGAVVGALAASAYLKKKGSSGMTATMSRSGMGSGMTEGRVDELSSAASAGNPETASVNAGDGTPSGSGMGRPMPGSSGTGLSESRH
ncbi:hypothetical protein [Azohydromonas caseinilytica]|uniref:Uncharacterized protein n=1 Tax=Azohydromonas caseinilytica TaxID=2728836 RepID=A0A848FDN4_9BURK|nr:hypothetical protein [Azohydromonas caseinilytica]NML16925.1 hypothetical protein [Azohydromonas caseinilytica]